jgi:tetratricopeptide (TPR) repeat protein
LRRAISIFLIILFAVSCATVSDDLSSDYYNVGNAYYDLGNYEKAIESYNRALNSDNQALSNKIRFNLAVTYSESGRVEEAVRLFELLLEKDPENLKVLQSLAYSRYLMGDKESALDLYDKILSISEFDTNALYNKSLILIEDDNLDDAEALLEKLYIVDDSVEIVLKLGDIYDSNEDWSSMVRIYEMSLIGKEQNLQILERMVTYYEGEGLYGKVIEYLDLLLENEKLESIGDVLFRKGSLQIIELNDFENGFESLEKAVDSGFSDIDEIKKLLEVEGLVQVDQLRDYFTLKGLY